jgi:hypothetical protein
MPPNGCTGIVRSLLRVLLESCHHDAIVIASYGGGVMSMRAKDLPYTLIQSYIRLKN